MIRSIRRLSFVVLLMFLAILANITYVQYFQAADVRARAGNSRVIFEEYSRQRGPILLGSVAIASSIPTDDQLKERAAKLNELESAVSRQSDRFSAVIEVGSPRSRASRSRT